MATTTTTTNARFTPGLFVWRELITPDTDRAKGFYSELFGWRIDDVDMGPMGTYHLAKIGEKNVGGMTRIPGETALSPRWLSYVSVADVDATARHALQAGGTLGAGPLDIPKVGRFAGLYDFDGAEVAALHASDGDPPQATPQKGEFCWETLVTSDVEKAKHFYAKVFGWQASGAGTGAPVLAVGPRPEQQVADVQLAHGMPPMWMTYVAVEKLEPTRERVTQLGGKVVVPLIEVARIGRIALIGDPSGALLGLFEPAPTA